jgi:hypothetical protein
MSDPRFTWNPTGIWGFGGPDSQPRWKRSLEDVWHIGLIALVVLVILGALVASLFIGGPELLGVCLATFMVGVILGQLR